MSRRRPKPDQPGLFDLGGMQRPRNLDRPAPHNRSDTSKRAAIRIDGVRRNLHNRIVAELRRRGPHGATAEELAAHFQAKIQTVSARLNELHREEFIHPALDAAGEVITRATESGKPAKVYRSGWDRRAKQPPRRHRRGAQSTTRTGRVGYAILQFVGENSPHGVTAHDIEATLHLKHPTVSARLSDLMFNHLVRDAGAHRDGQRVHVITWRGWDALEKQGRD